MSNPRKCALCGEFAMVLMFHICAPGTRREPVHDVAREGPTDRPLDSHETMVTDRAEVRPEDRRS